MQSILLPLLSLSLSLLVLQTHLVVSQQPETCPPDTTTTLVVHVTEEVSGVDVFDSTDFFFEDDSSGIFLKFQDTENDDEEKTFLDNFELPLMESTFQPGPSIVIKTMGEFDREDMAVRLGNPIAPVVFNLTIADLEIGDMAFFYRHCVILVIHVEDNNDNSPMFDKSEKPFKAVEFIDNNDLVGDSKTLPLAEDNDEGLNGTTNYTLVDDMGVFFLDIKRKPTTGEIELVSLKNSVPLDREKTAAYNLTLVASEGIPGGASDMLDIRVTVKPICDEPPFFETYSYRPSVLENATTGDTVIMVTAFDNDTAGEGQDIFYSLDGIMAFGGPQDEVRTLDPSEYPFMMDTESGVLVLEEELDREQDYYYEVVITASDGCSGTATATVYVTVGDINDNPPEIRYGGLRSVPESTNITSDIGVITVRDADEGQNAEVEMMLFERNQAGELVDSDTFLISDSDQDPKLKLKRNLDREMKDQYSLVIMAADMGSPSMTSTYDLTIEVGDVNDNDPMFNPVPSMLFLHENSQENTAFHVFQATDADAYPSNMTTYSLPSPTAMFPHQDLFMIVDTSGELLIASGAILDREQHEVLSVLVMATDNPPSTEAKRTASVVVSISLLDVNDNAAVIIFPNDTQSISEDADIGDLLVTVAVQDLDATPEHRNHVFSLTSSSYPFSIHPTSGEIRVSQSLDRESRDSYVVTVEVEDGSLSSDFQTFTIEITDVNDVRPRFDRQGGYEGTVPENMPAHTSILQLFAEDDDIQTEPFVFQFVSGVHQDRFSIDGDGVVSTAVPLDREDIQNYTFYVSVSDGQLTSQENARVLISVVDEDDHTPRAINTDAFGEYNFEVEENLQSGTFVGQIEVESLDTGDNGRVKFRFLGDSGGEYFNINEDTGDITTKQSLDREILTEVIRLNVEFEDLGDVSDPQSVIANVRVTDKNDEGPEFVKVVILSENRDIEKPIPANNSVWLQLEDSYPVGASILQVIVIDADIFPNNKTTFQLESDVEDFKIDAMGVLSLQTTLDFEVTSIYSIEVYAKDTEEGHMQNKIDVIIAVVDVPPPCLNFPDSFTPQYYIDEESDPDTTVVSFEVTNSDGLPVNGLLYTLTNEDGTHSLEFYIIKSDTSGIASVKTHQPINRDDPTVPDEFKLNVTVCDMQAITCDCVTIILTVTIQDINDITPSFQEEIYEFRVMEGNTLNDIVGSDVVQAEDDDEGTNGDIVYSVQSTPYVPFSVDSNGQLRVLKSLDYEIRQSYEFVVYATDMGDPPNTGSTNVLVEVQDTNDNDPVFDPGQDRNFPVSENTEVDTTIASIHVMDLDSDEFGPVVIEAANIPNNAVDNHFDLRTDGSLILLTSLDRETKEFYSFVAEARDGGDPPRSARAVINITVTDYNDHIPVFTNTTFSVSILESISPGSAFTSLHANDGDTGPNARIEYALANSSLQNIFCVHSTSGVISVCPRVQSPDSSNKQVDVIDYERDTRYEVPIVAYDNGVPRRFQTATLTVNILPVNEHYPDFNEGFSVVYIEEGLPTATPVAHLEAYDNDYDVIDYILMTLAGPDTHFRWDRESKNVVTNRRLDFESEKAYTLRLTATDGHLNRSVVLEVFVINVNDHDPQFDPVTPLVLPETTKVGSVVMTVHATDQDNDTSDAVTYSIDTSVGNHDNTFQIGPKTGEILLSRPLDFEDRTSFTLSINATDTGSPQRTDVLQLTITVSNENDELPQFIPENSYSFALMENLAEGSFVGGIEAIDHDNGPFGDVTYSLAGERGLFVVGKDSGVITSAVEFDREQLDANPITFSVVATDGTNSATAQVSVTIGDENDNGPVFSKPRFLFPIDTSEAIQGQFMDLRSYVTDQDQGTNANFIFEMVTPLGSPLVNLSSVGDLMPLQTIAVFPDTEYDITVKVMDPLNNTKFDTAVVQILLETATSHHPRFSPEELSTDLFENALVGESVIDISDYVSDEENDIISYRVEPMLPEFSLDSESGVLTLGQQLDFEQTTSYQLTVFAVDSTQRTASATLRVIVEDFNDEMPMFVSPISTITLSPIPYSNVEVFTVKAEDLDATEDAGTVFYSIVNSEYFDVDINTGVVINKGPLALGLTTSFILRAYDNGAPLKSSNITITVHIQEPGNMAPDFGSASNPLMRSEEESVSSGTIIYQFDTTSINVDYHLVYSSVSDEETFAISNGALVLAGTLDHEEVTDYRLIIEARREETNPLRYFSSYLEVLLEVVDVNDESPMFDSVGDITLEENQDLGIAFLVHAEDGDSGALGEVTYAIIGGNTNPRVFDINQNGAVLLIGTLDREQKDSYDLEIRASDGGVTDTKQSEITVHITVTDLNDYEPHFESNYTINVYESPHTRMGDFIGKITAIDKDTGPPLVYGFTVLSARFGNVERPIVEPVFIDIDSGEITAAIELDREDTNYYYLEVTAEDREHSTTAYLTIHVLDVNDHDPVISAPQESSICEHEPIGWLLTSAISASDDDCGPNGAVQFSLGEGWPDGWFTIDSLSGTIRVAQDITYDKNMEEFTGTVLVEDQGTPKRTASASITVHILDINDHTPRFEEPSYTVPVSTNDRHGAALFKFSATDEDSGVNSAYTVQVPTYYNEARSLFNVDTDGEMSLQGNNLPAGNKYVFKIEAINSRPNPNGPQFFLSSYADVTVNVFPVNEFAPVLSRMNYQMTLPENSPDSMVDLPEELLVEANDGDEDDISFSIINPDSVLPFYINKDSGQIWITPGQSLDFEERQEYSFTILVTDSGYPSRSANATVVIVITDVDEFSPVFDERSYSVNISESEALEDKNKMVAVVSATDGDGGSWGDIRYSIDDDVPFDIGSTSGEIFITQDLDYDVKQEYRFGVRAYNPPLLSSGDMVMVTVKLSGTNEYTPTFEQSTYSFTVRCSNSSGDKIGSVRAIDGDFGPHGNLDYTILTSSEEEMDYIRIENGPNNTGDIYLIVDPIASSSPETSKRQASLETYFSVAANVQASDGGVPPKKSTAEVTILLDQTCYGGAGPISPSSVPFEIIAVVVVAVVVAVLAFVCFIVIAMVCRMKRHSRKEKIDPEIEGPRNNETEMRGRYVTRGSETSSQARLTTTALTNGHSISGSDSSRHTYGGYADDEESISMTGMAAPGRYHPRSPSIPRKSPLRRSFETRSTSDLASTVGTDVLGQSQETGPYTKAQLAAIYAANAELLANSGSQDSVHMFGSEGGGEADGEVDIDNILLSKSYDLDDDDETTLPEDVPPSLATDSSGNLDVPPVEEREDPIGYGQSVQGWIPRASSMSETINEMAQLSYPPSATRRPVYEPEIDTSHGLSLYEDSTQSSMRNSHTSLIRHQQLASQQKHFERSRQIPMADFYYAETPDTHPPHPTHHIPPSHSRSHRYASATALMDHEMERHRMPTHHHYSQDIPYSRAPMHFIPPRPHTPPSETPTEGTVTPHRALANDYDQMQAYLTSSSTSIASTNCSQPNYRSHHVGLYHH